MSFRLWRSDRWRPLAVVGVQVCCSALLLQCLSWAMFQPAYIPEALKIDNAIRLNANTTENPTAHRLEKMRFLWPPPSHPALYLIGAAASHLMHSELTLKFPTAAKQIGVISIISGFAFVAISLPVNLAEMHWLVQCWNFVHLFATLSITLVVQRIFAFWGKEKTE